MSRDARTSPDLSPALEPKRVVILATPTAQSLEIAGPFEVLYCAGEKLREAGRTRSTGYTIELVSAISNKMVTGPSGLTFVAQRSYDEIDGAIDTLLVAGGMTLWTGAEHPALLRWLRDQARVVRRLGSICTGAFVLAQAGLLDGRRATTHWYFSQQLQRDFPSVRVDPEPIFIRDGNLYTSAGVATGMDLTLAMVEEDLGSDIALRVARGLVLYLRRSAGQSQFSTALAFQKSSRIPLRELPIWILEHLSDELSVERLADRAAMSVRNFSRAFTGEYGVTPARFVERLRVETAERLMRDSEKSIKEIAAECGFRSLDTLRRALKRSGKAAPSHLRDQTTPISVQH